MPVSTFTPPPPTDRPEPVLGASMGLGWDRALESVDLEPVDARAAIGHTRQTPVELRRQGTSVVTQLVGPEAGGWFEAERLNVTDTLDVDDGRFSVDIVLAGDGHVDGDWGVTPLLASESRWWTRLGSRVAPSR